VRPHGALYQPPVCVCDVTHLVLKRAVFAAFGAA